MRHAAVRAILVLLSGALAAGPAAARPSSVAMTCGQTVRLVRARGAVVIGTGGWTYDRFVRDRSFCEPTEYVRPAFAPTRDDPSCPIGYTCYEPGPGDWLWDD